METFSEELDFSWIGEDASGIWTRQHPIAAYVEFPEVWTPVEEFSNGIRPDHRLWTRSSAHEWSVLRVMEQANSREISRRREDDGGS